MPDPKKKSGAQLNKEAYEKSLLQAKKELAKEYVEKNMKDVTDSTLWNLPGNVYMGIPKYGINLAKGSFNAVKHQAKMIGLAQADNVITEGIEQIKKNYSMGGNIDPKKPYNTKPIVQIQPGVSNPKLGNGYYIYNKKPTDEGFNYLTDREFITSEAYRNDLPKTPQFQQYMNSLRPIKQSPSVAQFANGGELTHFNEGGTHEQNPNGGIPLGNNASVEQGETKKGNYIYSDRLYINEDLVKQFNLPSNIKGKTFANASKVIEKPFKDKNSNPDKATQKEHLDRLKQAQEVLKEQEAKIQQSMLANSQEIPDQMNGEIPEGMEEFVSGEREQFGEGGGWYDNNQPFFTNNPGPVTGPTNVPQQSAQPANSGMNMNMMGSIGAAMGSIGTLLSSNTKKDTFYDSNTARNERTSQQVGTVKDSIGTAIPIAGVFRGIEKAGGGIGKSIGGDTGAGITAAFSPDEAIMGNMQDSDSSTLEKIGGVFNPIGAGINTSRNAKKRQQEMSRQNAINANKVFRDKETVLAYGGYVDPMKKITNDVYNKYHYPLSQGTIDDTDLTTKLSNEYKNEVPLSLKPTGTIASQLNPSARLNKVSEPNKAENTSFLKKAGDYFKENQGEMLRLAPVAMNALQLANLKKPGHVSLNRLSNVYKPGYIDEAGIQNRLDSEHRNTINALTNASGGSDAALRASILGTQAARLRARGDAYSSIQQYNNGQDAIAQNFKLGIDQTNLGQSNLQQDINDKNMGNYDTQKSKLLGQIGTDLGSIGKEKVFAKKAGQMFGYDENGKYIITPEGKKSYIEKEDATKNVAAYGGYLRKNKKGY